MVKNAALDELADMFREPKPFIEFVLDEIISMYNLLEPKAKEAAMQEATAYLKTLSAVLQEEYKSYLASHLGINPSFIRLNQTMQKQTVEFVQKDTHRDVWELGLVKTVLEHPNFIDQILDVLEPSLLQFHAKEFSMALQGMRDAPEIMAILVDESIMSINDENVLRSELMAFLSKHYERELKKINMQKDISFEEKAFLIRKLRSKISALRQGEFK
jgi:DNA primase